MSAAVGGDRTTRSTCCALAAAVEADSEHPLAGRSSPKPSAAASNVAASRLRGARRSWRASRIVRRPTRRGRRPASARRARPRAARRRPTHGQRDGTDRAPRRRSMAGSSAHWRSRTRSGRSRSRRSRDLHGLGMQVAMITGDSQAVADSVARRLGIDEVAAAGAPRRQGSRRAALSGRWPQGRNGRRRRQRRTGAGHRRCRHRDRGRHRRGDRVGGHRPGPRATHATSSARSSSRARPTAR